MLIIVVLALRSILKAALLITSPDPRDPVLPPLPICKVPDVIVVLPVYVFEPVRARVPKPFFVRLVVFVLV